MNKTKECNKCFGKGYRTELKGIRELSKRENRRGATLSDSSGEQINTFTAMEFCNCDRGKELEIRVKDYADWKIKELQKEYNKLDKLCGKYSNVIAMVYDGERVDIAEKRVGLIK